MFSIAVELPGAPQAHSCAMGTGTPLGGSAPQAAQRRAAGQQRPQRAKLASSSARCGAGRSRARPSRKALLEREVLQRGCLRHERGGQPGGRERVATTQLQAAQPRVAPACTGCSVTSVCARPGRHGQS